MSDVCEARDVLLSAMDALGISYRLIRHAPVLTMQDSMNVPGFQGEDAVFCKNVVLCNRQKTAFYLMLLPPDEAFHTAETSRALGVSRLSFAPGELLPELLHLHSGAASPLGLWFDGAQRVKLIASSALRGANAFAFHPCDNTSTVVLSADDFFHVFLPAARHTPVFV